MPSVKAIVRRWLLRALVRLEKGEAGVPAITYHSIDDSGSPISFPASYCRAQLAWLSSRGYQSLTAREAALALSSARSIPSRSIVLTFDDGFRSVRDVGYGILAEHGFVGTVFCAAGYIGGQSTWPRSPGVPAIDMMSWDDLAFLVERGWEIGGHTASHTWLPDLTEERMEEEIVEGRRILEQGLGREVTSFAYPYGAFSRICSTVVGRAGFTSAWTTEPIINTAGRDVLTLGRFNCDRVRSDSPETAALAARLYVGGRYGAYALMTARWLRIRKRGGRRA